MGAPVPSRLCARGHCLYKAWPKGAPTAVQASGVLQCPTTHWKPMSAASGPHASTPRATFHPRRSAPSLYCFQTGFAFPPLRLGKPSLAAQAEEAALKQPAVGAAWTPCLQQLAWDGRSHSNGWLPAQAQPPSSVKQGDGGALLQHWLTPSLELESFFARIWERRPLLVQRNSPGFYGDLLSASAIHRQLQRGLQYALELDVVHYTGVVRIVLHAVVALFSSRKSPAG